MTLPVLMTSRTICGASLGATAVPSASTRPVSPTGTCALPARSLSCASSRRISSSLGLCEARAEVLVDDDGLADCSPAGTPASGSTACGCALGSAGSGPLSSHRRGRDAGRGGVGPRQGGGGHGGGEDEDGEDDARDQDTAEEALHAAHPHLP